MKNMRKFFLATLALLFICFGVAFGQGLMAGAAKVDVTPKESDLLRESDSIRGKLYVRALYLTDGKTPVAIVTVDGDLRATDEAVRRSSASSGIPAGNYIISGTHTHSPSTAGLGNNGKPSYEDLYVAIVEAVDKAKASARPAKVGYGKRPLDLNVNRDNYNEYQEWGQAPSWESPSDKDLTVLSVLGEDDIPIAVYMNYAMHPVNFFMSGVVSADFPGDACEVIEKTFGERTIALFSQNASGDQNPKLAYTDIFKEGQVKGVKAQHRAVKGQLDLRTQEVPADRAAAHKAVLELKGEYVHMLGASIAFKALEIMLFDMEYEKNPAIKSAETILTVPGRKRLDTSGRENYDPGYEKADDVHIGIGVVTLGEIDLVSVSAEIYSEIGLHIKAASPERKTMVISIADGPYESGYIYSDNAANHLTFQVIGSRVQPGYAEKGIVDTALSLIRELRGK